MSPLGLYSPGKCSELLNPTRESCRILSQRQPGKFIKVGSHASCHFYASLYAPFSNPSPVPKMLLLIHNAGPFFVWSTPQLYHAKKFSIRIHAPHSRQPLVKGERLIRFEVSAAMVRGAEVSTDHLFERKRFRLIFPIRARGSPTLRASVGNLFQC